MRSGESGGENPLEVHGEKLENFVGQKVEGFALNEKKEFPVSITLKNGATFGRGFDDMKGNYWYTRPQRDISMNEMLLVDKHGTIIEYVDQTERTSEKQGKRNKEIKDLKDKENHGRTAG